MSVAIRSIVRVQDADDAPALGASQDGYALTWDNASGAFVATALSAGVTDHGALTGLTPDDDHTQYALLAGRAGGQTLYGGTAANEDLTLEATSNATRTTSYVVLSPSGGSTVVGAVESIQAKLQIVGGTGAEDDQGVRLSGTYSSNTAHPHRVETSHPLADTKAVAAYDAKLHVTGAGALDHIVGFQARPDYNGTGTLNAMYDLFVASQLTGSGTTAARFGLYVADANLAAGALTNNYGVYVATLAAGTNKYGLYVAGNSSYFGGNISVAGGDKRIYGDTTTPFIELSNAVGTTIAYGANCQLYLGGPIFFTTSGQNRMGVEADGSFWVGERVLSEATAYIHQAGTTSALPVLLVKQSDVSEEFISFVGTSTTDASQSLVDATDMTTPGAVKGWLKIHVEDLASSGAITDGFYYVPFYAAPTA